MKLKRKIHLLNVAIASSAMGFFYYQLPLLSKNMNNNLSESRISDSKTKTTISEFKPYRESYESFVSPKNADKSLQLPNTDSIVNNNIGIQAVNTNYGFFAATNNGFKAYDMGNQVISESNNTNASKSQQLIYDYVNKWTISLFHDGNSYCFLKSDGLNYKYYDTKINKSYSETFTLTPISFTNGTTSLLLYDRSEISKNNIRNLKLLKYIKISNETISIQDININDSESINSRITLFATGFENINGYSGVVFVEYYKEENNGTIKLSAYIKNVSTLNDSTTYENIIRKTLYQNVGYNPPSNELQNEVIKFTKPIFPFHVLTANNNSIEMVISNYFKLGNKFFLLSGHVSNYTSPSINWILSPNIVSINSAYFTGPNPQTNGIFDDRAIRVSYSFVMNDTRLIMVRKDYGGSIEKFLTPIFPDYEYANKNFSCSKLLKWTPEIDAVIPSIKGTMLYPFVSSAAKIWAITAPYTNHIFELGYTIFPYYVKCLWRVDISELFGVERLNINSDLLSEESFKKILADPEKQKIIFARDEDEDEIEEENGTGLNADRDTGITVNDLTEENIQNFYISKGGGIDGYVHFDIVYGAFRKSLKFYTCIIDWEDGTTSIDQYVNISDMSLWVNDVTDENLKQIMITNGLIHDTFQNRLKQEDIIVKIVHRDDIKGTVFAEITVLPTIGIYNGIKTEIKGFTEFSGLLTNKVVEKVEQPKESYEWLYITIGVSSSIAIITIIVIILFVKKIKKDKLQLKLKRRAVNPIENKTKYIKSPEKQQSNKKAKNVIKDSNKNK